MKIPKSSNIHNWIWAIIFGISIIAMFYLGLNPDEITRWWASLLTYNAVMILFSSVLIYKNIKDIRAKENSGVLGSKLTLSFIKMVPLIAIMPILSFYIFSFNTLQNTIYNVEFFADDLQKERKEKLADIRDNLIALKLAEYQKRTQSMLQFAISNNSYDTYSDKYNTKMKDIVDYFGSLDIACRVAIKDGSKKILADSGIKDTCSDSIIVDKKFKNLNIYHPPNSDVNLLKDSAFYQVDKHIVELNVVYILDNNTNSFLAKLKNAEESQLSIELNLSSLRNAFLIDMSSTLLLVVLVILLIIFKMINTLMSPLSRISAATKEVSAGNYDVFISHTRNDDTRILVDLFNEMAKKVKNSQDDLATQKVYLETILKYSYGVIAMDNNFNIKLINKNIGKILQLDSVDIFCKQNYKVIADIAPKLKNIIDIIDSNFAANKDKWFATIEVAITKSSVILLSIQGACLYNENNALGYVVIIDDITELRQAQNRVAWAAVAMKMAHEVKNPLTPILLSAQRLRDKILPKLNTDDAKIVDKTTAIISQQVKSIDTMVSAFAQYTKSPTIEKHKQSLVALVTQTIQLYNSQKNITITTNIADNIPDIMLDTNSMQRALINLLKNSIEASKNNSIEINLTIILTPDNIIELVITDNGPGFSDIIMANIFQPYVSTKGKGGGLGMAIVKNILIEHGASIDISNIVKNAKIVGAMVKINFKIL